MNAKLRRILQMLLAALFFSSSGQSGAQTVGALLDEAEKARRGRDAKVLMSAGLNLTKLYPNTPEGWNYLGIAHEWGNSRGDAETAYLRATEVDPNFWKAWMNLGSLHSKQKKPDAAISAMRRSLSLNTTNDTGWVQLALVYEESGKTNELKEAFKMATTINPTNSEAWLMWAFRSFKGGVYAESERLAREGLVHLPQQKDLHTILIESCRVQSKFPEMMTAIADLGKFDPDNPIVRSLASLAAPKVVREFPKEITTLDGKTYKNIQVRRVEPDAVTMMFEGGGGRIPYERLSPEHQVAFGLDPKRAEEFRKAEKEKLDAQRRALAPRPQATVVQSPSDVSIAIPPTSIAAVQAQIKARAAKEWPGDFRMQEYEIKNQNEALAKLNAANYGVPITVLREIKAKAVTEWPGDYRMQEYEVRNQTESYKKLRSR